MSSLSPVCYQYRSSNSIYRFKVKNEEQLSLKILDLSKKCFLKKTFLSKDISLLDFEQFLAKGNFTLVLEKLIEERLLTKEELIPLSKKIPEETDEQALAQLTEQYKSKVCAEKKENEAFSCPLTKCIRDEQGHVIKRRVIVEKQHLPLSHFEIMEYAFGKAKWEKYFGDIGLEPPLPANIEQILNSPCSIWPDQTVRMTHLLGLIPETVNGKPFHLDSLSELIKSPKTGHKTQCSYYDNDIRKNLGTKSLGCYWFLITKDIIPNSRNKRYDVQKVLVQRYAQISGIRYELPQTLEAATAILMHYVETGEALYTSDELKKAQTFTRCQEQVKVFNNQCPTAVGGFSSDGLGIISGWSTGIAAMGVAGSSRFLNV